VPDAGHEACTETCRVSEIHRNCNLRLVAEEKVELCPRELCTFWEPGGAVVAGACVIERLGLDTRRHDVASFLLELRERLEEVRR
jgi:hypothetical protein